MSKRVLCTEVIDRFNSEGLEGLNPRPGFALQYLVCKEIE